MGFDSMDWADSDSGGGTGDDAATEPLVSSPSPSPPPPPPKPAVQLQYLKPPPERYGIHRHPNVIKGKQKSSTN
ncbi:hypothetical protein L9F63_010274, partial [Diploptera punctata]